MVRHTQIIRRLSIKVLDEIEQLIPNYHVTPYSFIAKLTKTRCLNIIIFVYSCVCFSDWAIKFQLSFAGFQHM